MAQYLPKNLNTGDKYQLIFVTSVGGTASSAYKSFFYYNTFVQDLWDNSPIKDEVEDAIGDFVGGKIFWRCCCSLGGPNAETPQNATSNVVESSETPFKGIYRLDGERVSESWTKFWNGDADPLDNTITIYETGEPATFDPSSPHTGGNWPITAYNGIVPFIWSGTKKDGTVSGTPTPGSTACTHYDGVSPHTRLVSIGTPTSLTNFIENLTIKSAGNNPNGGVLWHDQPIVPAVGGNEDYIAPYYAVSYQTFTYTAPPASHESTQPCREKFGPTTVHSSSRARKRATLKRVFSASPAAANQNVSIIPVTRVGPTNRTDSNNYTQFKIWRSATHTECMSSCTNNVCKNRPDENNT